MSGIFGRDLFSKEEKHFLTKKDCFKLGLYFPSPQVAPYTKCSLGVEEQEVGFMSFGQFVNCFTMHSNPGEDLTTCCQEVCREGVLTGALSCLSCSTQTSIVQNSIDILASLTATGGARA